LCGWWILWFDKCLPKVLMLKTWSPQWCYWEMVKPLGGRAYGRSLGYWGHALKENFVTSSCLPDSICECLLWHMLSLRFQLYMQHDILYFWQMQKSECCVLTNEICIWENIFVNHLHLTIPQLCMPQNILHLVNIYNFVSL
jgi:hypothetical protein